MWQTVDAAARLFFTERSEEETDFQYWYNEGINHKTRGDHRQAAEAFQNAAEQAPAMAEAWHNVGFSRLALDQAEQGAQALSVAVKAYSHRLER
ncbi:MAG TPA: hypothetical protein VFN35_04840, partial [Ktedonobacteraceae bacterium]|nr:hypothetical protein [Ktedonobacteraceae bacterium]